MESAASRKKARLSQYATTLSAILIAISCGLSYGWPTPTVPKLLDGELSYPITKAEVSYIVMLGPAGCIIGSPISGFLMNYIGRKKALLSLVIPLISCFLLVSFSTAVWMLYLARVLGGIAEAGVHTTLPIYICEISQAKIRGKLGIAIIISLGGGVFLMNCIGSFVKIRLAALIAVLFPVLFVSTFIRMPETPYYLLMKGNREGAQKSLSKLRDSPDVDDELSQISRDIQRQISESGAIKDVFLIKCNFKALLIMIGLKTLQHFVGGGSMNFYNQYILQQVGAKISHKTSSILYYANFVFWSICGIGLIDRFGRKPLLMLSSLGATISLSCEGVFFYMKSKNYDTTWFIWVPILGLLLYSFTRSIGLSTIPTLMVGEMFSASIKAKAAVIVHLFASSGSSISSKLFFWLSESYGLHTPFFVFTGIGCTGMLFIYFCVPETKGKTLEEIQIELKGHARE